MTETSEQTMLDYVLEQLDTHSGKWPEISRESGVPYHTLTKIAYRKSKDPRYSTVDALASYFRSVGSAA